MPRSGCLHNIVRFRSGGADGVRQDTDYVVAGHTGVLRRCARAEMIQICGVCKTPIINMIGQLINDNRRPPGRLHPIHIHIRVHLCSAPVYTATT